MKICKKCNKEFVPSSGHLNCPSCRGKNKTKKCVICGELINRTSTKCRKCCMIGIDMSKRTLDRYTGFRKFLTRARSRGRLGDLSLEDLIDKWNEQKCICVYSGVILSLPKNRGVNDKRYTASLDRINSMLPYEKGNIQFVSAAINAMKGELTHKETIELCFFIHKHVAL